ncbi:MAG: zinc transporter 9 [Myxococcota bacterium]|jgi:zinc transporter 9
MAGGSKLAVYTAITANAVVTVAKFAGFAVTGSGSMLSEGVHSLADVGNQALLALGMRRAQVPADADHPLGYGREAFVWSLISAVGMFFMGCGVSITHGVQSLLSPHAHAQEGAELNIAILVFALVVEGAALLVATRGLHVEARSQGQSLLTYLRTTDDPFGVAVILEDSAAVLGVLIALAAVWLANVTGHAYWDAFGSIAIGVLLGLVAVFLIAKNRALLIGRAIRVEDRDRLEALLEADEAVDDVVVQRAMVIGASAYRINAEIKFNGDYLAQKWLDGQDITALHARLNSPEALEAFLIEYGETVIERVGDEVDRLESRIREVLPKAKNIALEPD